MTLGQTQVCKQLEGPVSQRHRAFFCRCVREFGLVAETAYAWLKPRRRGFDRLPTHWRKKPAARSSIGLRIPSFQDGATTEYRGARFDSHTGYLKRRKNSGGRATAARVPWEHESVGSTPTGVFECESKVASGAAGPAARSARLLVVGRVRSVNGL